MAVKTVTQLKQDSESILKAFFQVGSDIKLMKEQNIFSDAEYGRKAQAKRQEATDQARKRIDEFNRDYQDTLRELTRRADREQMPKVSEDSAFFAKMQLWLNVYSAWPLDKIKTMYEKAVDLDDNDTLYFAENVLVPTKQGSGWIELHSMVNKVKESRISETTRKEIADIRQFNRFFETSTQFNRQPGGDQLRNMIFSLGQKFDEPYRAIFA